MMALPLFAETPGFAEESGVPGRHFRESRRRPRAQSKLSSENKESKRRGRVRIPPRSARVRMSVRKTRRKEGQKNLDDT